VALSKYVTLNSGLVSGSLIYSMCREGKIYIIVEEMLKECIFQRNESFPIGLSHFKEGGRDFKISPSKITSKSLMIMKPI